MTSTTIIMVVCILAVLFLLSFKHKNNQLKQEHNSNVRQLSTALNHHKSQVIKRQIFLDTYDFLRYNLREALLVQQDIRI